MILRARSSRSVGNVPQYVNCIENARETSSYMHTRKRCNFCSVFALFLTSMQLAAGFCIELADSLLILLLLFNDVLTVRYRLFVFTYVDMRYSQQYFQLVFIIVLSIFCFCIGRLIPKANGVWELRVKQVLQFSIDLRRGRQLCACI